MGLEQAVEQFLERTVQAPIPGADIMIVPEAGELLEDTMCEIVISQT